MKKLFQLSIIAILFVILTSCSKENLFDSQFDHFKNAWKEQNFEEIYLSITEDVQKKVKKEDFINRFNKIYNDLDIKNIQITSKQFTKEEKKKGLKQKKIVIPIDVQMESIAGSIHFDTELIFKLEKNKEKKKNWLIDFKSHNVFPHLKEESTVSLEIEEPERGEIIDRNRMPLAINGTAYEIGIVPEKFSEENLNYLSSIIQMDKEKIKEKLNANWVEPHLFVPLKKIPETNESIYKEAIQIKGVTFKNTNGRIYPSNEAAAHLVGYIGEVTSEDLENEENVTYLPGDLIGKRGIEKLYEERLRGEPGATITVKTNGEEKVIAEKEVKNGETIQLTIDINLQEKVFESYGQDAGTSAVINPKNGETLALVSSPSFNPNDFVYDLNRQGRLALEDDPRKPLFNRFSATFAPGSAIKPITASIGLNNGSIDEDEKVQIEGLTWSNGKGWGDYKVRRVSSTGQPVDLKDALVRSDNIYFAMKAVNMGEKAFIEGLKQFGFGEKFPFSYPINQSQISNSGNLKNEVLLANTSYGQGEIQLSALHLATTYTPLFNNGNLIKPILLKEDKKEVWHKKVLAKNKVNHIKDALREVVTNNLGTAHILNNNEVDISGKTGTVELKSSQSDKNAKENSWFVGYPTKEEDLLISMMVENTQNRGPITLEKVSSIINDWVQKEE